MTRKVVVHHQGNEYRVNGDNLFTIVKEFSLDGPLNSDRERLAALGLMYLNMVSWQGGGAGDITHWDRFLTEHQKSLLEPALEVIARYHNTPVKDLRYR